MAPNRALRLGIVPYLNVAPLICGLEETYPQANWVRATPRELAGLLANAEVDVAIISTFEALRAREYRIVPDCAIGCDGPVRSVCLFSDRPVSSIRRLLLDRSSLTSINLARVLAHDLWHVSPEFVLSHEPIRPDVDWRAQGCDGAVVIGDTALAWEHRHPVCVDLGTAWKELTGLPFIFAVWCVRPGARFTQADADAFRKARERGEAELETIIAAEAARYGRPEADVRDYLGRAIRHRLAPEGWCALEEFRRRLISRGLLPASVEALPANASA